MPATRPGRGLAAQSSQCSVSNKGTRPNALAFLRCARGLATLSPPQTLELTLVKGVGGIVLQEERSYGRAEKRALSFSQPWHRGLEYALSTLPLKLALSNGSEISRFYTPRHLCPTLRANVWVDCPSLSLFPHILLILHSSTTPPSRPKQTHVHWPELNPKDDGVPQSSSPSSAATSGCPPFARIPHLTCMRRTTCGSSTQLSKWGADGTVRLRVG